MPGDAALPMYVYLGLQDQFFKAYTCTMKSLSEEVRSCIAVTAAVGFVLHINLVALALALPEDSSFIS